MNDKLIELRFATPGKMGVLASTVIFVHYTKFLEENGELDFVDEIDSMTDNMVSVGEKIKKVFIKDLPLRLEPDEYQVMLYVVHFVACILVTDEGETWYKNTYFPIFGAPEITKLNADEAMKGYLRFADNFINRKIGNKQFDAIRDKVRLRMNELFPLEGE